MYVDSNHLDYHYLVEFSDNYVVLTNRRTVNGSFDNPIDYPILVQYLNPSISCFESTRTTRSSVTFSSVDVSDNFYDRADCPTILTSTLGIIFFLVFILNGITRIVKKGGIFFG